MYCTTLANVKDSGLCNQIFSLVSAIVISISSDIDKVIIDNFMCQIQTDLYCSVSEIIDLNKTNEFLNKGIFKSLPQSLEKTDEIHKVTLIDKNNLNFTLISVHYGKDEGRIDITDMIINKCYYSNNNNKILYISKNINFDQLINLKLEGDKYLYITYYLGGNLLQDTFSEEDGYLDQDIIYDLINLRFIDSFYWLNRFDNIDLFNEVLINIKFKPKFYEVADKFIEQQKLVYKTTKINLIHLRIEEDGVIHWAKINNMFNNEYQTLIEKKYIDLITTFIDKDSFTLILSADYNNKVIKFLTDNNYNFGSIPKDKELGRDYNGIFDLCLAKHCNKVFIGNFNPVKISGSSFSYTLMKTIDHDVTKVMIDLDHIMEPHIIV